jgi:hypothetical protein
MKIKFKADFQYGQFTTEIVKADEVYNIMRFTSNEIIFDKLAVGARISFKAAELCCEIDNE